MGNQRLCWSTVDLFPDRRFPLPSLIFRYSFFFFLFCLFSAVCNFFFSFVFNKVKRRGKNNGCKAYLEGTQGFTEGSTYFLQCRCAIFFLKNFWKPSSLFILIWQNFSFLLPPPPLCELQSAWLWLEAHSAWAFFCNGWLVLSGIVQIWRLVNPGFWLDI